MLSSYELLNNKILLSSSYQSKPATQSRPPLTSSELWWLPTPCSRLRWLEVLLWISRQCYGCE
jgi:hypothetical protein